MAEEDNWGSWSAEPSAVPETLDSHPTAAEAMPEVLDSPPTASQVMPEVLDPTSTVEALQVRNPSLQPRLQLAAATLTSMTPVPALGSMPSPSAPAPKRRRTFADLLRATPKVRSTGRVAARAWDQASEASSSREFYLDLNRLPDPIAELSPLAYKMYAKAGPETTRLVGRALERYNKMLMLDYSEEVMEPKETPVIPCWTALERCLEEDLAEAKKLEESAGDFVESIFGPIYSCTPKKEFDSASVGCLTEDLEEQTRLRLSRIRLGSFLGKINIGNTEALESLRSIRSYLVLEDLHGYRLLVGSTYDFQHARVGDLEEARKDPQFLRRMEALEDSLRAGSLPRCLGIFVQGMMDAGGTHPLQRNTTSAVPELGVNTKAFLVRSLQKVMVPREPVDPPSALALPLPPAPTMPPSAEQMQAAGYGAVGIHPPVEPPLPRGIAAAPRPKAAMEQPTWTPLSDVEPPFVPPPGRRSMGDEEARRIVNDFRSALCTWQVQDADSPVSDEEQADDEQSDDTEPEASKATPRDSGFVLVTSQRGTVRLHRAGPGGCWMARARDFRNYILSEQLPEPSEYTHRCRLCWAQDVAGSSDESSRGSSDHDTAEEAANYAGDG